MKLLLETKNRSNQSYYDLGFKIKNPIKSMNALKEGYIFEDDVNFVNKVCISDAHTHYERLVFPAWTVMNTNTEVKVLTHDAVHISGAWTMLIHGGDESTMRKPEVYARHIRRKYGAVK